MISKQKRFNTLLQRESSLSAERQINIESPLEFSLSGMKGSPKYQSGAVLAISLIMLLLLMLIGVSGMQNNGLEEKMAGNMRDRNLAFQAAETALSAAEASLSPTPPTFTVTTTNGSAAAASPFSSGTAANLKGYYATTAVIPAIDVDAFWTFDGNYRTYSGGTLNGIVQAPRFIIQDLGPTDCPGSAVGSLGCRNYRITARATGGTTSAVVMLQSVFTR